jgi:hypothetical protein
MALQVRHQAKPERGITYSEIPMEIREAVESEWKFIQEHPDQESVFADETKAQVDLAYQYAVAYGKGRSERLELRRSTATKNQPETEIRFTMKLYKEDAPRPGRPAARS